MDSIIELVKLMVVGDSMDHNGWNIACRAGASGGRAFVLQPAGDVRPVVDFKPGDVPVADSARIRRVDGDDERSLVAIDVLTAQPPVVIASEAR